MQPFQAVLTPSHAIRIALALLHGVTLYLLWRYFTGWQWGMMSVLTLASFAYTQYLYSSVYVWRVVRIEIRPNGQAVLYLGGENEPLPAHPLSGSLVSRYALLIRWRLDDADGRVIRQVIFPDMTDHDAYRRLCVWLRYGENE